MGFINGEDIEFLVNQNKEMRTKFKLDDLPDLSGQNIIITGGTAGLGLASATGLASKGAHVIITARSVEKGEAAVAHIKKKIDSLRSRKKVYTTNNNAGDVSFGIMELESLESVKLFASWVLGMNIPIHVLMLNAGVCVLPENVKSMYI